MRLKKRDANIVLLAFSLNVFYLIGFASDIAKDTAYNDTSRYIILAPSHKLKVEMQNVMTMYYNFIKFRTDPRMQISEDSLFGRNIFIEKGDTILLAKNVAISEDSTIITLKSGISWNLKEGPPVSPPRFYFKLLSKKGRSEPEMADRLKYLRFCGTWKHRDGIPCDMVDNYKRCYSIMIDGHKCVDASFEMELSFRGNLKFRNNDIVYYRND